MNSGTFEPLAPPAIPWDGTALSAQTSPGVCPHFPRYPVRHMRQTRLIPPRPRGAPGGSGKSGSQSGLYAVRVMDNPTNTYQEVIDICVRALPLTGQEAFDIAYAIDHDGSCVVCVGPEAEMEGVAQTIRGIGIEVRLEPYAPDS